MKITAYREKFDLKRPFIIARGKRTHAEVIRVELEEDGVNFEGECSPTLRYGETVESVMEQIGSLKGRFASGPVTREALVELLPLVLPEMHWMRRCGNTTYAVKR